MSRIVLRPDVARHCWVAGYDHHAMRKGLPADCQPMLLRTRIYRHWNLSSWEAALELALCWLWTKHELLTGEARPPSAAVNEGNRPALAAGIQKLTTERLQKRPRGEAVAEMNGTRLHGPGQGVHRGTTH